MIRSALSEQQLRSRAKNAVAKFLFEALVVPKIFFDAHWPSRRSEVDILAVDRAGAGEIHIAQVKARAANLADAICALADIPAHFKYLALFESSSYSPSHESLYAPDGMGRIGIIRVREDRADELHAEFAVRPERFRLDPSYFKQIDKFTGDRPADMELRP